MARLTPSQRAKVRRATQVREPDPSEDPGELNIVPFLDIVVNLMLFLLATSAAVMTLAQEDVSMPGICRGRNCPEPRESIQLSVTVTGAGVHVAAENGQLAAGCETTGLGPAVPGRDYEALASCLSRVHERFPEETGLTLSADPEIPFEDLVRAMDAARPSFPEIRLSAGVR